MAQVIGYHNVTVCAQKKRAATQGSRLAVMRERLLFRKNCGLSFLSQPKEGLAHGYGGKIAKA